jgi:hypothetical protein
MVFTPITTNPKYGPGRFAVDYFVWYQPGVQSVLCPDHGALRAVSVPYVILRLSLQHVF